MQSDQKMLKNLVRYVLYDQNFHDMETHQLIYQSIAAFEDFAEEWEKKEESDKSANPLDGKIIGKVRNVPIVSGNKNQALVTLDIFTHNIAILRKKYYDNLTFFGHGFLSTNQGKLSRK